jgi:hypothetical protein
MGGGNPSTTRTPDAAAAPNVIGGRISDQANAGFQFVLQQPQVERGRHLVPYTGAMTFTPVSDRVNDISRPPSWSAVAISSSKAFSSCGNAIASGSKRF